jgi:hypothetical protein
MKQLSMNDQEKESLKILGIKNSYWNFKKEKEDERTVLT